MRRFICLYLLFLLCSCALLDSGDMPPTEAAVSVLPTVEANEAPVIEGGGETAVTPPPDRPMPPSPNPTATPRPAYAPPEGAGAWTVLVYVSADSGLDAPGIQPLINQLELAGLEEEVTVLVQIDRGAAGGAESGTRRYRIVADSDQSVQASDLLMELGEQNMGDPLVLADFVAWGVATYPAAQTGLLLTGQGGGWRGVVVDETTGIEQTDDLSLPDLTGALNAAFDQSGLDRLDLLVLDAPQMNTLTVAAALSPLAELLLLPTNFSWLTRLDGLETGDGTLVELTAVPQLAAQVETLAFWLNQYQLPPEPVQLEAREGDPFADPLLSVLRLSERFQQEIYPDEVRAAARALSEGWLTAVSEDPTRPLTLFAGLDEAFAAATSLTEWAGWLQSGTSASPAISLHSVWRENVGLQQPAYFAYEVASGGVSEARLVVLGESEEGENGRLLLQTQPLGQVMGVVEEFVIWTSELPFLTNEAGEGAFVLGERLPDGAWMVQGRVRRPNTAVAYDAWLRFSAEGQLLAGWAQSAGRAGFWEPIELRVGDIVQTVEQTRLATGELLVQGGAEIVVDGVGLRLAQRTLPDGAYWVGIEGTAFNGESTTALTPFIVHNSTLVPGYRTYLDSRYGFQFRYPADWPEPTISETLITGGDGATRLQVRPYPELAASATLGQLREETLATFGAVDILYEDRITIGGVQGLQVAYGYEDPDFGGRTGQFLAVISGQQGAVIDVDGLQVDEAETLAIAQALIESWEFVPTLVEAGEWTRAVGESWSVAYPTRLTLSEANGWQKFSSGDTFLALQERPLTADLDALLAEVVADAGAGLDDFVAEPPRWQGIGSRLWRRVDFGYGETRGFIGVLPDGESGLVAWAETGAEGFVEEETAVFLPLLASLE